MEGPLKRCLALDLDVAGETVRKDDVGWPFSVRRVGDGEISASRVPELVAWIHADSLLRR